MKWIIIITGLFIISCNSPKEVNDYVKGNFPSSSIYEINPGNQEYNHYVVIKDDSIFYLKINRVTLNIDRLDLVTIIR